MKPWKGPSGVQFKPRESDIYLVSYPRSGSTWLRFVLSNLIRFESGDPVDFHSVHQVIPDIMQKNHLEMLPTMSSPRLLKSHHLYKPEFKKVIYLLRDGRDVMVSYYHYLTGKNGFEGSFLEFLKKKDFKSSLWHKHVQSWLAYEDQIDMLLIRYEDLCVQTESAIIRIAEYAGLPCDEPRLHWAISHANFDAMLRIETEKGLAFGPKRTSPTIRKGMIGDWKNYFGDAEKKIFKSYSNEMLIRLGYVENEDW